MITLSANFRILADHVKAACLWAKAHLLFLALLCLCVSVPLWLLQHDARLRRDFEFRQLRHQAAAEIATLRARAAAALDDADAGAQRVRDLEAQRLRLERAEADLRSEISNLKAKERARIQEWAALPFPRLAERLRSELGPGSFGPRGSGLETRGSEFGVRDSRSRRGEIRIPPEDETRNSKIENRESSAVGYQLPGAGSQLSQTTVKGPSAADNPKSQIQNPKSPNPETRIPDPELLLTEPGARAVAAALVERDACREQAQVKDGLLANCQEQAAMNRAVMEEMNHSLAGLREAVRLKDEIQSRREAVHRAELKAARGSRLRRFGRALQCVGAGVVIGVVVAQ